MEKKLLEVLEWITDRAAEKVIRKLEKSNLMAAPQPQESKKLTRKQVAEKLQVSLVTLHSYINKGLLTPYKIGGKVLFDSLEVEAAIDSKEVVRYKH